MSPERIELSTDGLKVTRSESVLRVLRGGQGLCQLAWLAHLCHSHGMTLETSTCPGSASTARQLISRQVQNLQGTCRETAGYGPFPYAAFELLADADERV